MRFCSQVNYRSQQLDDETGMPHLGWARLRRRHLRDLRRQTKSIIIFLALRECMTHSPMQLAYSGRHGFPGPSEDDFGISYTVAGIISYIYVSIFMVIFVPFFSWWVCSKSSEEHDKPKGSGPSVMEGISNWLGKVNMVLLPLAAAFSATLYIFVLIEAFLYPDVERTRLFQAPRNTKGAWKMRGLLLTSIAITSGLGYGAMSVLKEVDLAHVKPYEYALILVPIQINLGFLLATKIQKRIERRLRARTAFKTSCLEAQEQTSLLTTNEKNGLPA